MTHRTPHPASPTLAPRILIAGIGNIFLGDDAFGVEVARRLEDRTFPDNVRAADFGIRGIDLVYALLDGCDIAIFVDAVPRGGAPGTLYLLEPEIDRSPAPASILDAHGMNPVNVLRTAQAMGARLRQVFIVGCEPATAVDDDADIPPGLSTPVAAAIDQAIAIVETLVQRLASNATLCPTAS